MGYLSRDFLLGPDQNGVYKWILKIVFFLNRKGKTFASDQAEQDRSSRLQDQTARQNAAHDRPEELVLGRRLLQLNTHVPAKPARFHPKPAGVRLHRIEHRQRQQQQHGR